MKSKITIHTAPNFKPCIKVVEPTDQWMNDGSDSDDVRDVLVRGFREQLNHKSNTVELIFQGSNQDYILCPVEDELSYFERIIITKYINDSDRGESLLKLAKMIQETLNQVKSPEVVFECALCEREYFSDQRTPNRPNVCLKCTAEENNNKSLRGEGTRVTL